MATYDKKVTKGKVAQALTSGAENHILAVAKDIWDEEYINDGSDNYTGKYQSDINQELNGAISGKQDTLVSGTNIKTINGESVLGSGDITIEGGSGSLDDRLYTTLVPKGTSIPANADLQTTEYLKVGKYFCSRNIDAKTLKNCPTSTAFMMEVLSPLSPTIDNEDISQYVYRLRRITVYNKGLQYWQLASSDSTPGDFKYGDWYVVPMSIFSINRGSASLGDSATPVYLQSNGLFAACTPASMAAGKLTTARKISLSGGAVGSTTFDGSKNVELPVNSLYEDKLTWGTTNVEDGTIVDNLMVRMNMNALMFMPADSITIEHSQNGGTTWTDAGLSDLAKIYLVSYPQLTYAVPVGKSQTDFSPSNRTRVILDLNKGNVYARVRKLFLYLRYSNTLYIDLSYELYENYNTDTWQELVTGVERTYSRLSIAIPNKWSYMGLTREGYISRLKIDIYRTETGTGMVFLSGIALLAESFTSGSNMARYGSVFTLDHKQNATFPAKVTAINIIKKGGTSSQILMADGSTMDISSIGGGDIDATDVTDALGYVPANSDTLSDVTTRVANVEIKADNNEAAVQALGANKANQSALDTTNSNVSQLSTNLNTTNGNLVDVTNRVSTLESGQQSLQSTINGKASQSSVTTLSTKVGTLESNLANVQDTADSANNKADTNAEDIININKALDTKSDKSSLNATNTNVSNLTTRLATAEEDIDTLQDELSKTDNTATANTEAISTINSSISTINSKLNVITSGAGVVTNISDVDRGESAVDIYYDIIYKGDESVTTGESVTIQAATTTTAGVMSAADKKKLDGIIEGYTPTSDMPNMIGDLDNYTLVLSSLSLKRGALYLIDGTEYDETDGDADFALMFVYDGVRSIAVSNNSKGHISLQLDDNELLFSGSNGDGYYNLREVQTGTLIYI